MVKHLHILLMARIVAEGKLPAAYGLFIGL
jgi:hypothetical protein